MMPASVRLLIKRIHFRWRMPLCCCSSYSKAFEGDLSRYSDVSKAKTTKSTTSKEKSEILYLNASGSDERSFSSLAYRAFCEDYKRLHPNDSFMEVNLWRDEIVKYSLVHVQSKVRMLRGIGNEDDKELFKPISHMINQLVQCDKLILSTPMWNYSIPYILKQYIDIVVQPGVTFKETENGPVGLVSGKPMLLITSSGADYSKPPMMEFDFLFPYLKCIFGLIGFTDIRHISISNTANSKKEEILKKINLSARSQARTF